MRKVLVGALIVCLSLGLAGMAYAVDTSWSSSAEFGIEGSSEGATGFFSGCANIAVAGSATSGPWSAGVTAKFDSGEGPVAFLDAAFIKYTASSFGLTMQPLGIDNGLYDIEIPFIADLLGFPLGIPSNPGIKLDVPMEAFNFFVILNNTSDGDQVIYNFAGGIDFAMGPLGLGFTLNSDQENDATSYAAKVSYSADALTLVGQIGGRQAEGFDASTGMYGKLGYTLPGGGAFCLSYNTSTTPEVDEQWSKIYGEFSTPVAEKVNFVVWVENQNNIPGDWIASCITDFTKYGAKFVFTL